MTPGRVNPRPSHFRKCDARGSPRCGFTSSGVFRVAGPFFSLRSSSHRAPPPSRLPPPTRSCCPASNPPPPPPRPPPPLSAPQVTSGGWSILHYCMEHCETALLEVAKLLIEHGADVNAARAAGWCRESSRSCGRCDVFFASELSQGHISGSGRRGWPHVCGNCARSAARRGMFLHLSTSA